jgi:hypothetical protein
MTCWPGVTDLVTAAAGGLLLHRLDELARDGERNVGLQQRHAHLAHGGAHVILGQRALLGEPVEDAARRSERFSNMGVGPLCRLGCPLKVRSHPAFAMAAVNDHDGQPRNGCGPRGRNLADGGRS